MTYSVDDSVRKLATDEFSDLLKNRRTGFIKYKHIFVCFFYDTDDYTYTIVVDNQLMQFDDCEFKEAAMWGINVAINACEGIYYE